MRIQIENPDTVQACISMTYLDNPSIGHSPDDAAGACNFGQLREVSESALNEKAVILYAHTFSCQPKSTLPLTSPHPGSPIPLYKYFMRVSWESWESDLTAPGISVALVLLRIVTSVWRLRF